jgi:endonuclease-8
MPEGDTVHAVADVLSRELPGRTLERLELKDRGEIRQLRGAKIERVEAIGKHLLVHIEGGWTLRVHLGMKGSWRRFDPRDPRPPRATVTLLVGDTLYACINNYRSELIRTSTVRTHPRLARLGPDLLEEPPRIDEVLERAMLPAHAGREMADFLLDQRVASGIGNIYKSELLFELKMHPRTRVGSLDREAMRAVFTEAARLMRLGLATKKGMGKLAVYGRAGRPCKRCRTPIERFLQGDMARSTYYCPRCQAETIGG